MLVFNMATSAADSLKKIVASKIEREDREAEDEMGWTTQSGRNGKA